MGYAYLVFNWCRCTFAADVCVLEGGGTLNDMQQTKVANSTQWTCTKRRLADWIFWYLQPLRGVIFKSPNQSQNSSRYLVIMMRLYHYSWFKYVKHKFVAFLCIFSLLSHHPIYFSVLPITSLLFCLLVFHYIPFYPNRIEPIPNRQVWHWLHRCWFRTTMVQIANYFKKKSFTNKFQECWCRSRVNIIPSAAMPAWTDEYSVDPAHTAQHCGRSMHLQLHIMMTIFHQFFYYSGHQLR